MKRLLLVLLLALCAGLAHAETLAERYWRLHRERNATTRYGAPPTGTNSIPSGYRLLEYVESTGAQYVDTGLTYFPDFEVGVQMRESVGNNTLGVGNSGKFGRNSAQKPTWKLIVNNISLISEIHVTSRIDASYRNGVFSGNGTIVATRQNPFSSGQMLLFSTGENLPTSYPCVMFYCRLIDQSGALVRDYIPVADANGVAGLWDRVSGTMFYSATSTPLVAGPELRPATVLPTVSRETVREMIAPAPTGEPPELAGGDLWLDCLAIPEGNWLCECPIAGTTNTAWRAALCPSNILRAVVWRHAVGLAPTNLPVTLEHDPSRVIGRIERLFYEAGTGVVARISVTQSGYAWAVSNHCTKPSPDTRCFTTGTNVAIRTDGWIHEHQDYIEARCVPRGEDMSSVTNVPAGVQAIVMAPVYLRGLSLVGTPLLPTYIEQRVPDHLRDVYPLRPPRQWDWRNGY